MQSMKFTHLHLSNPLLRAIQEAGYSTPTDIQQKAIPAILAGKDVIGCAQTGTGKTAAFAIPLLELMEKEPSTSRRKAIRALVLTPTRELAIQVEENIQQYGKYLDTTYLSIFGGVPQGKQEKALNNGIDLLIATPGRLLDLINQGIVVLSNIEYLILDEADKMLDMGFVNDVKKVLTKVPEQRQMLFFTATMNNNIRQFADTILRKPIEITVNPVSSTAKTVEQSVCFIEKAQKTNLLVNMLEQTSQARSLVFTRTKHGADKLVKQLSKRNIFASAIHGDKSQNARQKALDDFKSNKINVLIATDIAARGIDIEELPLVINYELPNIPETYVHRIGRTGRAGRVGKAISFCSEEEEKDFKNIEKLIGFSIPIMEKN